MTSVGIMHVKGQQERLIISSPSREKCNNHCSLLSLRLLAGVGNISKLSALGEVTKTFFQLVDGVQFLRPEQNEGAEELLNRRN